MYDVSKCCTNVRINDISFLVFSNMILGSSDWHRRQFGAITMDKLLASILVVVEFSGSAKICTNTYVG